MTRSSVARLSWGPWAFCGRFDSGGRAWGGCARCPRVSCCWFADRLFVIRRVVFLTLHMGVVVSAIETNHAIAPGLLRHVESIVRRLQQGFLIFHARMGRGRHSAAHRPAKSSAGICKSMTRDLLPQPLGEGH